MEGASPSWRVGVSEKALDPAKLLAEVGDPTAGAVVLFLGTARDHSEGKAGITHLEYEAYPEMVEQKLAEIAGEACRQMAARPIGGRASHRRGFCRLPLGGGGSVVGAP